MNILLSEAFFTSERMTPKFQNTSQVFRHSECCYKFFLFAFDYVQKSYILAIRHGPIRYHYRQDFAQTNAKKPCFKLKFILSKRKHFLP